MRTENDLKTILQILIQKEKEEQQYIDKKISDFFKLLFSDLVIKDNKENNNLHNTYLQLKKVF